MFYIGTLLTANSSIMRATYTQGPVLTGTAPPIVTTPQQLEYQYHPHGGLPGLQGGPMAGGILGVSTSVPQDPSAPPPEYTAAVNYPAPRPENPVSPSAPLQTDVS